MSTIAIGALLLMNLCAVGAAAAEPSVGLFAETSPIVEQSAFTATLGGSRYGIAGW